MQPGLLLKSAHKPLEKTQMENTVNKYLRKIKLLIILIILTTFFKTT